MGDHKLWSELTTQLRADSIRCTTAAGSGHPTSSMSAADVMAVLLADHLHYDFNDPHNVANDRLIFSKGHASPLLYSMYKAAGVINDEELLTLRKFGSRLEGHPTPELPWVDVATGSLGQGLPTGVGMALSGKYLDKVPFHVWVLLGDSEMAEGAVWEAFGLAGHYQLSNITAILDMNRLGQRGQTMLGWNAEAYCERAKAFGWQTISLNGGDLVAMDSALRESRSSSGSRPTLIVIKTEKGSGVSFLANQENWHGKALSSDQAEAALTELGNPRCELTVPVAKPTPDTLAKANAIRSQKGKAELPRYEIGAKVATREAYGDALKALGVARNDVVAVDGEVSNSTYADRFAKAFPDRYFEIYISEQHMVSAAVGLSVEKKTVFGSTFAAFLTRAYDQIRMAAVSRANIRLVGSHAGVSIGEDGPSQMGLEDLAMFRSVYGSTVLYPSCANATAHLVEQMADRQGILYMRTTREKTPVIYSANEAFHIGGSKVVHQSDHDAAAVIAAGITLQEALKAYEILKAEGVAIRVIDAYSVKPIDADTLHKAARECRQQLIVVEDHWPEGGIGDAVSEVFDGADGVHPHITRLAVRIMPGSGKPAELLEQAGIDADHIVSAVRKCVSAS